MSGFVRESRFRNIEVKLENREKHYEQLRVSNALNDGNYNLTCNSKFVAYIDSSSGSSALGVLPLSSVGKNHVPISAPAYQQPLIRAHSQAIQDIQFNLFNTSLLHSCSNDGSLKTWTIPVDGLVVDQSESLQNLTSNRNFQMKGLSHHPVANNILAVRGIRDISIFDLDKGIEVYQTALESFKLDIQSISWSYTGHLLVATSKDKQLRLFDLRLPSHQAEIAKVNSHTGTRPTKSVWLGDSSCFVTVGHSASIEREILSWDERNFVSPINRERLDGSTGAILPIYDSDNNLLVLGGKGDTSLRLFECTHNPDGSALHPIHSTNVGSDIIRGLAMLPKQANDLYACEIIRLLKLTDTSIQPISFTVPRKERRKFHEDLFPPSIYEAKCGLTSEEYLNGKNARPERVSISAPSVTQSISGSDLVTSTSNSSLLSQSISPIESPTISPSTSSFKLSTVLKYRHMYGSENPKASTFYNLTPQTAFSDSPLIACSDTYWAVPYQGGGGPVYVSKLDNYGKVEPGCAVINGHKMPVQDIAFSPFRSGLLATGSGDSTIKLWSLPEDPSEPLDLTAITPTASITAHTHSIRTCNFHPVVPDVLVSSSYDMFINIYDINSANVIHKVNLNNDGKMLESSYPNNVSFNYDGSVIAVSCKDRVIRLVDPRYDHLAGSTIESNDKANVLGRNLAVTWCFSNTVKSSSCILSVSTGNSGMRQLHTWDPRNLSVPTSTLAIDNSSGQLIPMYDEDIGVVFLAGKGDTIIRYYELNFNENNQVNCVKSNEFQSSKEPIAGICMLPKRTCNVVNTETSKLLKLTIDSVIPISFITPRAENLKGYFHDDIFVPTRSKTSTYRAEDWIESVHNLSKPYPQPIYESLRPEGMPNMSEKPVEVSIGKRSSVALKATFLKQEEENKARDDTFSKLQGLAIQRSKYHPNASNSVKVKGEAKPVEDDDDNDDEWED